MMQKEVLKFDSSSVMEGMVSLRAVIKAREVPKFRSLLESIPTHAIISQCLQSHSYSLLQRLLQSSTFALQKVFYLLRHSREALDIAFLLDSFGWSDEEANQQVGVEDWVHSKHDVHELLVLLIEKLDREWKE